MKKMFWEEFKYSKNQVKRASKKLVENKISLEEKLISIKILANFRSFTCLPYAIYDWLFQKKSL